MLPDYTVLNMSCPFVVMRFYLVYSGPLSASGNKSKSDEVPVIRNQFHPQLRLLWETTSALNRLRQTAIVPKKPPPFTEAPDSPFYVEQHRTPHGVRVGDWVDLCEPIKQHGKSYIPLVRTSLDLNCHLQITFLRQEDPGALVLHGGDLDNRIKTLFDALRIPDADASLKFPPKEDPTYCLLEDDSLISGFDVDTGRLLMPQTTKPNEVHLVIEVTVRVLMLGSWNVCLMGN
jgi:hypothetical protein